MVFSYYLYKYPYQFAWSVKKAFNLTDSCLFYSAGLLDNVIFSQVQKHLIPIPVVAQNKKTALSIKPVFPVKSILPAFPEAVIMTRHACHKFPDKRILKFGFRHGAYNFKKMTHAENYKAFTRYFVSSSTDVGITRDAGIYNTVAIGYPKLDPAFNGEIDKVYLNNLKKSLGFSEHKQTLLFTTTWDKSGMSAIETWIDKLDVLSEQYNILVTVHPWTSQSYKMRLFKNQNIHFISHPDTLPYLMLADCVIGDNSSILGEACALDKSILTIQTIQARRSVEAIDQMIKNISFQIPSEDDLTKNIEYAINHPLELQNQRQQANRIMYDDLLDGNAGKRAANLILEYLPELKP